MIDALGKEAVAHSKIKIPTLIEKKIRDYRSFHKFLQ